MTNTITQMPDHARLWIYQAERPFTAEEEKVISQTFENFIAQWAAHGQKLMAGYEVRHHQFIVLSVDESVAKASGCSIDASIDVIRQLENHLQINLLDRSKVAFLIEDKVILKPFNQVKDLISEGLITRNTPVFNNLVENTGDWKNNWLVAAENTWLNRYFSN